MAIPTVRNLKPEVHQKLREQAAAHGRSTEAEARAILEAGVRGDATPVFVALRRFAQEVRHPPRWANTQRLLSRPGLLDNAT